MINKVPLSELSSRKSRFAKEMDKSYHDWEFAVIFSKINQYYFTGTMQEGMLIIPRSSEPVLWVRRSFERAMDESQFSNIKEMGSYKDATALYSVLPNTVYIETEFVPLAMYQRFNKYFGFKFVESLDLQISKVRALKSEYELNIIKQSGVIHKRILEDRVPQLLKEGMSEAQLAAELYRVMIDEGHHGVARFGMLDTEIGIGHICFGESSLYPTYFNGPGGHLGMSPAVPLIGSHDNILKKGDLVFIDIGCGKDGYHTDKTTTYMYGKSLPDYAVNQHNICVDIQNKIAKMLLPGAIPSQIYNTVMSGIDNSFLDNFMGYGSRKVKFLGHGIGLTIDEYPVIAEGFDEPLLEGMVIAIEPKKGIKGIGMVGIENTFIVSDGGGVCITGDSTGLIPVY